MNAFFGGRAECRIRRMPLPVVYIDFTSMYPTVNALLGNWAHPHRPRNASRRGNHEVRDFVAGMTLDDCFRPETWSRLAAFVKVRPRGEVVPRAGEVRPARAELADRLEPADKRRRRCGLPCPTWSAAKLLLRADARDRRSVPPRSRRTATGLARDEVARRDCGRPAYHRTSFAPSSKSASACNTMTNETRPSANVSTRLSR